MENLFNVNQAAFILKLHPLTLRRYIKEEKLKALKIGGNIRIKESELQAFGSDFSPKKPPYRSTFKKNITAAKIFTISDPLFRIRGRGASIKLSS